MLGLLPIPHANNWSNALYYICFLLQIFLTGKINCYCYPLWQLTKIRWSYSIEILFFVEYIRFVFLCNRESLPDLLQLKMLISSLLYSLSLWGMVRKEHKQRRHHKNLRKWCNEIREAEIVTRVITCLLFLVRTLPTFDYLDLWAWT